MCTRSFCHFPTSRWNNILPARTTQGWHQGCQVSSRATSTRPPASGNAHHPRSIRKLQPRLQHLLYLRHLWAAKLPMSIISTASCARWLAVSFDFVCWKFEIFLKVGAPSQTQMDMHLNGKNHKVVLHRARVMWNINISKLFHSASKNGIAAYITDLRQWSILIL